MNYIVKDVLGDGSCFFRSVYTGFKDKGISEAKLGLRTLNEDAFVSSIRKTLWLHIKEKNDMGLIHEAYKILKETSQETYDVMLETFPDWFEREFRRLPTSEAEFRERFAAGVLKKQNWVGQIEVTLTKEIFKHMFDLKIHVFNTKPSGQYRFARKTIYVLNKDEAHYNAIIPLHTVQTPPKPPPKPTKICPDDRILNKLTNRCVLKWSCTGLKIRVQEMEKKQAHKK